MLWETWANIRVDKEEDARPIREREKESVLSKVGE